ncbi:MAG: hypothetical protein ACT4QC_01275 [Planctomycetaceae bacterium]
MNCTHPAKRRGPIGWLTVRPRRFWILVAPVAYLSSLGPTCLIWNLLGRPGWYSEIARAVYLPLVLIHVYGPGLIDDALNWYMRLWGG